MYVRAKNGGAVYLVGMRRWRARVRGILVASLSVIFPISLSPWAAAHNPLSAEADSATVSAALLLALLWVGYLLGSRRVAPRRHHWWLFQIATGVSVFTLFGPLDHWAETNTAMHMVQHMLMMVVIAPLLVAARPLPQWHAWHARPVRWLSTPLLWGARFPLGAACAHGVIIWLWHTPRLYVLALEHPWWHFFEHLCFLVTAGVFWWAVLRSPQRTNPRALLALLITLMHTGFLGALLTFSPVSLYGEERLLAHQQLAGLLMWVLGGLPYFAAALWVGWRLTKNQWGQSRLDQ